MNPSILRTLKFIIPILMTGVLSGCSGATELLWLEPGDYSFTLESIGPPVKFPAPYRKPESSPLHVNWNSDMTSLVLQAPENLLRS